MVGVILVLCSGPSSLAIILLWNEELVALLVVGAFVCVLVSLPQGGMG